MASASIPFDRLQPILESAAIAEGNRQRFQSARLLEGDRLVSNWQEAFLRLSPLTRQQVRENPAAFLANAQDIVYRGRTSGTQGQHLVYFAGQDWNRMRVASRTRFLSWWGIDDHIPILNVASRLFPMRDPDGAIAGPLTAAFLHHLVGWMAEQPTVLRGYPSRLCEVAVHLAEQPIPPIVAVICTGECLFDSQLSLLKQVFGAPVINEYGCQETGISGFTCPEMGRLHLDSDRCWYEVIDGQLVTTDLWNHAMPMVRYQGGDVLQLDPDSCPCGRPGVTAQLLGRREERIRTATGDRYPGELTLPSLEGILNYQIIQQRLPDREPSLIIRLQPHPRTFSYTPLTQWVHATFGSMSTQLQINNQLLDTLDEPAIACDASTWVQQITQASWMGWLRQPTLPTGGLRPVALLLKELIQPTVITNRGVSPYAHQLLQACLSTPSDPDPQVAWMTARVLLFACSCWSHDPPQAIALYREATELLRFLPEFKAAALDLLIPTLYLGSAWVIKDNLEAIPAFQQAMAKPIQPDSFTVHHLLQAMEVAVLRAIASPTIAHLFPLRPLLAVLIGDLSGFTSDVGTGLLAHWFELLHGQPAPFPSQSPANPFTQAWLHWRQQVLQRQEGQKPEDILAFLGDVQVRVRSPQEQARVDLERGYGLLLTHHSLDPDEWLPLLPNTLGKQGLGKQGATNLAGTPLAWAPILKALAAPLLRVGRTDLAYDCLVAATVPTSKVSAFEQLAMVMNHKQPMVRIGD